MSVRVDPKLSEEVAEFGNIDAAICMHCGMCTGSCPLSSEDNPFPRQIIRYLQLGLREKLLRSPEPWLCYYCGDCSTRCPRDGSPGEMMMTTRRWLTAQYDWTGLAKRLYLSHAWEIVSVLAVAAFVVGLFYFSGAFTPERMLTDRVSVNTFAPVLWVELGDWAMAVVLTAFLLSNAYRMYRYIMGDQKIPLSLYIQEGKTFVLNFLTQKRWRECGEDRTRWLKHFLLVTGYMTMMALVIVFLRWFQVDSSQWHFTSLLGYYATAVLLAITIEMMISRLRKKEEIHKHSEFSDWMFLVLLFLTTLTGIFMHAFRITEWPLLTYYTYVVHLSIAVPMLVVEVPFGKWSHLFYRPLAVFLVTVKARAAALEKGVSIAVATDISEPPAAETDAEKAVPAKGVAT